jgi:hypothetical protein
MPICEADPWRRQYFDGVACPPDLRIPTEDADAWRWYPAHRWIYDKLAVALSQSLGAAPHGVPPDAYPVFSKPICNLRGMGLGSRRLDGPADYAAHQQPGHMWMPLLTGAHVSSDVAVVDGAARWWRHARGIPAGGGMFDHWVIQAQPEPALEASGAAWIAHHLAGYTGMVNLETIGGVIIEAHLRFADQWPDLYGPGWVEALVGLYRDRAWRFADRARRTGYSVVLFGPHGRRHVPPSAALQAAIRAMPGVSSLQITFHPDLPPEAHAMPPGGFRVAIVNCWDRGAGETARARLRAHFAGA